MQSGLKDISYSNQVRFKTYCLFIFVSGRTRVLVFLFVSPKNWKTIGVIFSCKAEFVQGSALLKVHLDTDRDAELRVLGPFFDNIGSITEKSVIHLGLIFAGRVELGLSFVIFNVDLDLPQDSRIF